MADEPEPQDEPIIKETDIVFECGYCGKSLCIDRLGAGLDVPCTDCGEMVEVPVPDEILEESADATGPERDMARLLRKNAQLRRVNTRYRKAIESLSNEVDVIQRALDQIVGDLVQLNEELSEDV